MHSRPVAWLVLVLLAAGCGDTPPQSNTIPDRERAALEALYRETGGDQWRMRNGWLEEPGSECGWYGVTCTSGATEVHVSGLRMHRNRLTGTLPRALEDLRQLQSLDLHSNRLAGEIPVWFANMPALKLLRLSDNRYTGIGGHLLGHGPAHMDFSGNRLTGMLPAIPLAAEGPVALNLSGNAFTGALPKSWAGLGRLQDLDLSGNRLSGELPLPEGGWPELRELDLADNEFSGALPEGMARMSALRVLDLSGNEFSGSLPEVWKSLELEVLEVSDNRLSGDPVLAFEMASCRIGLRGNGFEGSLERGRLVGTGWQIGPAAGRVDLCFNPLEIAGAADRRFFTGLQAGGGLDGCLNRQRVTADAGINGSWHDPVRPGNRLAVMGLDDGTLLVWRFGHDLDGRQQWQFAQGRLTETGFRLRGLLEPRGMFGRGFGPLLDRQRRSGALQADLLDADRMQVASVHTDSRAAPCRRQVATRQGEFRREGLSGVCRNPHTASLAGLWYDPDRYGEGLIVLPLEDSRMRVFWATFTADDSGRPLWLTGTGNRSGQGLDIRELVQPEQRGGQPVELPWGRLELRVHANGEAEVRFASSQSGFGTGRFPVRRLASPAGC